MTVWSTNGTLWSHAVAVDPNNAFAHQHVGYIELESGHPDKAIGHFQFVLKQRPEQSAKLEPLIAICQRYAGQPRNAARMYNEVGLLNVRQGYTEYARARFEQAVAIAPEDVFARNNLALALIQLGRSKEARWHLELVLSQKPDYVNAHVNLGDLLENAGELRAARDQFSAALKLEPRDLDVRERLDVLEQRLRPMR